MTINNYKFEIYLEGYLIPGVLGFSIQDSYNNTPKATISISATYNALKLLAGTVVQIFGNYNNSENTYLLFEGEINSISYSINSDAGEVINIHCSSLLDQFYFTKMRPSNAVVTRSEAFSTGIPNNVFILNHKKHGQNIKQEFSSESGLKEILSDPVVTFNEAFGNNSPGAEGNFLPFLKDLVKLFEQSDILYSINNKSLNISDSIFLFPNPKLSKYFQINLMLETFKRLNSSLDIQLGDSSVLTLKQILNVFTKYLYYRPIHLAAPTASNLFYSNIYPEVEVGPIRSYYVPGIETGPPILNNIIFYDEILDFKFSRDLKHEITRLLVRGNLNTLSNGNLKLFSPVVISPDVPIINNDNSKDQVYTSYTDEELYRGVVFEEFTLDAILNKILVDSVKSKTNSNKDVLKEEKVKQELSNQDSDISKALELIADRLYQVYKYNGRTASVSCNWDPSYVVGLPGLVILDNMPALLGIVSGVSHSVNTNGSLSTIVTFSNCKFIYYNDNNSEYSNPFKDKLLPDNVDDKAYAGLEYAYNQELYSYENIGKFLYSYISTGEFNFSKMSNMNLDLSIWKEFNGTNSNDILDNSILRYIRDESGNIKNNYTDLPDEDKNFNLLVDSLKELVNKYSMISVTEDGKNQFIRSIKLRNLITKEDYLKFIGGYNPSIEMKIVDEDTKDLKDIFNSLGNDVNFLRYTISKLKLPRFRRKSKADIKQEYKSILDRISRINDILDDMSIPTNITTSDAKVVIERLKKNNNYYYVMSLIEELKDLNNKKQNYQELLDSYNADEPIKTNDILALYRPYNLTRKAHVIEAFKDIRKTYNIEIKGSANA